MAEITFSEARERAHRAVHDRPDDIDLIMHNYGVVLFRMQVPYHTLEACILELFKRWELSPNHAERPAQGELLGE